MNAADDSMLEAVPGFPWPNPAARLILTKLYLQCTHRDNVEMMEGIICELSIVFNCGFFGSLIVIPWQLRIAELPSLMFPLAWLRAGEASLPSTQLRPATSEPMAIRYLYSP